MKLLNTRRRVAVIGAAVALVLAGGGAAFAYFTSTGTGTGAATVGTASNYTVVVSCPSGGPLTPGTSASCTTHSATSWSASAGEGSSLVSNGHGGVRSAA